MALNAYGLTIRDIRAAAAHTANLGRENDSGYFEIFYDFSDCRIWTVYNPGASNSKTYPSPSIISVCTTRNHMTMQQIADRLWERMRERQDISDEQCCEVK